MLSRVAAELFGHEVVLVDSAEAMARAAREALAEKALLNHDGAGSLRCFVTDDARIGEVGARFLGRTLGEVVRVDL
jgi:glutamate racemase